MSFFANSGSAVFYTLLLPCQADEHAEIFSFLPVDFRKTCEKLSTWSLDGHGHGQGNFIVEWKGTKLKQACRFWLWPGIFGKGTASCNYHKASNCSLLFATWKTIRILNDRIIYKVKLLMVGPVSFSYLDPNFSSVILTKGMMQYLWINGKCTIGNEEFKMCILERLRLTFTADRW
jgi:hypothetical protein